MTCNAFRFGLSTILLAIALPIMPPDGPSGTHLLSTDDNSIFLSRKFILIFHYIEGGGEEEEEEEDSSIVHEVIVDQDEKDAKVD